VFELLGISLLLAALLSFNSLASIFIAATWRLLGPLTRRWSAMSRARLVFSLRIFPGLLAILGVSILLVPAYLAYEPRHTGETVSLKLGALAFLSAIGIALAASRFLSAWRATARLTADWMRDAEPIQIAGITIATYRIDHAFPVIAIVGVIRPRLFIARQVLELLTPDEVAAAVAHENGHLAARDNLKRGLLRACRDALLIIPSGRSLDRSWSEAAEEAADETAARQSVNMALDLASALVKIARIIPEGARPTMPAGVFLVGDDETAGIKGRVRRLIELANRGTAQELTRRISTSLTLWFLASLLLLMAVFLTHSMAILATVHVLIERAVLFLT